MDRSAAFRWLAVRRGRAGRWRATADAAGAQIGADSRSAGTWVGWDPGWSGHVRERMRRDPNGRPQNVAVAGSLVLYPLVGLAWSRCCRETHPVLPS